MKYSKTVEFVDLGKFNGDWYVLAARPTMFEKEVHNGIEHYDIDGDKVSIKFTYNQGSFQGEKKLVKQSGSIYNKKTNAHWKVSPFWPLKFDFLVIALADDYSWTAVGVPSTKYLWIMARKYAYTKAEIDQMIQKVSELGYPVNDIVFVPHKYE